MLMMEHSLCGEAGNLDLELKSSAGKNGNKFQLQNALIMSP